MNHRFLVFTFVLFIIWACQKEKPDVPDASTNPAEISIDLNDLPYPQLSDYGFFEGPLAELSPAERVLPYDVITPLFSDYASKKRFIWMPTGVSATYVADDQLLSFANGTIIIKNFYYDNVQPIGNTKILETRIMYKKNELWEFANYVWNDEQSEAILDQNGSFVPLQWMNSNNNIQEVTYRIPNVLECETCHKSFESSLPIGLKPQHLDMALNYSDDSTNQLLKWQQTGYLTGNVPTSIASLVAWNDESQSLKDRVRAYLDMNCAHCHTDGGHCDYRAMRFAYTDTQDESNMGVCIAPEEAVEPQHVHIISAGNTSKSVLHFRLNTAQENFRMPLLGRTVIHHEAVELLADYINSLSEPCN